MKTKQTYRKMKKGKKGSTTQKKKKRNESMKVKYTDLTMPLITETIQPSGKRQ